MGNTTPHSILGPYVHHILQWHVFFVEYYLFA